MIVNVVQPGAGMNVDVSQLDAKSVETYAKAAEQQRITDFLLNVIPTTIVDAFAKGDILQVLLFSVLFGFALHAVGERARPVFDFVDRFAAVMFRIVGMIMRLAPIGAFGAMAFTIGQYGLESLASLGKLMACFYATVSVLHLRRAGHDREAARLQHRAFHSLHPRRAVHRAGHLLQRIGAAADDGEDAAGGRREAGGRAGHSDRLFVQPRRHVHLPDHGGGVHRPGDQCAHVAARPADPAGRAAADFKGAAGVTGSGFIVLAATLSALGTLPVTALALILGIDRFMSEARALTNLVGNGVATIVVAKWCRALDENRLREELG